MARILLAWELGGDYGHLMRLLTLGRELSRRGHEPVLAVRELTHVDALLGDEPFRVFQAPIFVANVSGLPAAIGYAETLMRLGFVHPSTLTALCRAWRNLVEALAPQLMLFDYAPTGLLATRGLPIPRALFGSSFSVPAAHRADAGVSMVEGRAARKGARERTRRAGWRQRSPRPSA